METYRLSQRIQKHARVQKFEYNDVEITEIRVRIKLSICLSNHLHYCMSSPLAPLLVARDSATNDARVPAIVASKT